ncbi:MAG: sugar phosphate isomerase/epimerase [Gemmataceae bacterium]
MVHGKDTPRPRPVILLTGPPADLPLRRSPPASPSGATPGSTSPPSATTSRSSASSARTTTRKARLDLRRAGSNSTRRWSAATASARQVGDAIDARQCLGARLRLGRRGEPAGGRCRATEEVVATVRAAQRLAANVVRLHRLADLVLRRRLPRVAAGRRRRGRPRGGPPLEPVLEARADGGVRYAFEVHPGQIAFDLYSAELLLDALDGREEFGFTFDPTHLFWQGIDPVEFVRRFPDRIYHVHVKDVAVTLNGRSGLLGSYLPYSDPRRGWSTRCPGRGGLDWEGIVRALNAAGYEGALAVEWSDPGMDRAFGAEEACRFVKRLDFDPPPKAEGQAFR